MDRFVGAGVVWLTAFNSIGVIVAVVWLATLGRWATLGLGLVAAVVGAFAIGLALLPGLALATAAARSLERHHNSRAFLCTALSLLSTYVVIAAWSLASIGYFAGPAHAIGEALPLFLFGYVVATAPLSFLAIQEDERRGTGSRITLISSQIATAVGIAVVLIARDVKLGLAVFGLLMGTGYLGQLLFAQQRVIEATR